MQLRPSIMQASMKEAELEHKETQSAPTKYHTTLIQKHLSAPKSARSNRWSADFSHKDWQSMRGMGQECRLPCSCPDTCNLSPSWRKRQASYAVTDAINCRQHHYKTVKKKIANIPRNGLDGPTIGFAHSHCHPFHSIEKEGPAGVGRI